MFKKTLIQTSSVLTSFLGLGIAMLLAVDALTKNLVI